MKKGPARKKARIDPRLLEQVRSTRASRQAVEAIICLRSSGPADQAVAALLEAVERRTGEKPREVNVFKNLGSFLVVASPRFLKELFKQTDVESACANTTIIS